jgi:3-phenylpropionate/trans-cinnamate dioxygenase ferredoxin component
LEHVPVQKRRIKVGSVAEILEGRGREVTVEGQKLALFKANGGFFALSNLCLHRGGPLSEGEVSDYKVTCPWHGWKYDVRTGAFDIIPTLKVKAYRVEEKDGELFVEIE